jgi:hypothetical protein
VGDSGFACRHQKDCLHWEKHLEGSMTRIRHIALLLIAAAAAIVSFVSFAPNNARAQQILPPLSPPRAQYYAEHPQEWQGLLDRVSQAAQQFTPAPPLAAGETPAVGGWTSLTNSPGVALQNPLLMADGTVIAMRACTGKWYKLTPDNTGSYINGTWAQIATMPSGYGPLFGGSGVLPDGRVMFVGGEYNDSSQSGTCPNPQNYTSLGAIYDPVANSWTNVNQPPFWTASIFTVPAIGDAAGIILDNGTYMQTACCYNVSSSNPSGVSALLNPSTLTWTATGSGKRDPWAEESMAKLQNGNVLVVDANIAVACNNAAEIYNATTGTFSATGSTIDQEPDCANPASNFSYELGPLVVRQDGSAVIFPGVLCSDGANTNCSNQASGFVVVPKIDLYNVSGGTWSTLATMPRLGTAPSNYYYTLADAPAAVLPSGNVLFAASPNYQAFVPPTHFFELNFSSGTITQVGDTADAASNGSYVQNFLLLPTGQVLGVSQVGNIQIYTPLAGSPQASWAPVITSAPGCVSPGGTYVANGTQLNGLTEGSYYGDDAQASVNFPVLRMVNNSTQHVFYARTFNHSTRSIAPNAAVQTSFKVASATELGASTLYAVGAGIPSAGIAVTVRTTCLADETATHDFNFDGKSDILWRDTSGNVAIWEMNGTAILNQASSSVANVPTNWSIAGTGDFNGDGMSDILWRDGSGNVAIWEMNGTTILNQASSFVANVPVNWSIVGTGDFNGDNKSDILWRDSSGNVAIWEMNGTTILNQATSFVANVAGNWSVFGNGDYNGDGRSDILWHDTSGNVAVWEMNGTTVLNASTSFVANVPGTYAIAGTGDFNGDGKSDILWRDGSGNVAIWEMNGTTILNASTSFVANVPGNWTIFGSGDYNAAGKSDIVWHDSSGNVAIWEMNGTTVLNSSTSFVANVPGNWSIQDPQRN